MVGRVPDVSNESAVLFLSFLLTTTEGKPIFIQARNVMENQNFQGAELAMGVDSLTHYLCTLPCDSWLFLNSRRSQCFFLKFTSLLPSRSPFRPVLFSFSLASNPSPLYNFLFVDLRIIKWCSAGSAKYLSEALLTFRSLASRHCLPWLAWRPLREK